MADPTLNPTAGLPLSHVDLLRQQFPEGFARQRRAPADADSLIEDFGPLDATHAQAAQEFIESGRNLGADFAPNIQTIRHTHHRLAQYLSMGMDETKASVLCNYSPAYVSRIKHDPAFAELLAYYAKNVEGEFTDFVSAAKDLSIDLLGRLREILDTEPEKLTASTTIEAIKMLADRTGNAPVNRSVSISANVNMGDRLRQARERAALITISTDP